MDERRREGRAKGEHDCCEGGRLETYFVISKACLFSLVFLVTGVDEVLSKLAQHEAC